jgi:Lon protease-like protein
VIEIATGGGDEFPREVPVGGRALPSRLPVLPLRETVPFPDALTPLAVGQERSIELVNDVLQGNRMLLMVASKDGSLEVPGPDQLHEVGVVGVVARMLKVPDGTLRILVQAGQRARVKRWARRLAPWSDLTKAFRLDGFYERFPAKGQVERVARIHRELARAANIERRGKAADDED